MTHRPLPRIFNNSDEITRDTLSKLTGIHPRSLSRLAAKGEIGGVNGVKHGSVTRYFPAPLNDELREWISEYRKPRAKRRTKDEMPLNGISTRALRKKLVDVFKTEDPSEWSDERLLKLQNELRPIVKKFSEIDLLLEERGYDPKSHHGTRPPFIEREIRQFYKLQREIFSSRPDPAQIRMEEMTSQGFGDPWDWREGIIWFCLESPVPLTWIHPDHLAGPPLFWADVVNALEEETGFKLARYTRFQETDSDQLPQRVVLRDHVQTAWDYWDDPMIRKNEAVWETVVSSLKVANELMLKM